ncbi:MAG: DUF3750 domain-containing protein [Betaproteobacteria bacterium]|nr:DUF3750 domain-containing protein [Betaproteobacteria bacterium]
MLMLLVASVGRVTAQDWATASQAPVGLAPDPLSTQEAVVQVYAARAWGMKGIFGTHTWVAVKPARAGAYTVYEIIGWRLRWSESALVVRQRAPDARWYGSEPDLIADKRGPGVDELIVRIDKAARKYPWGNEYTVWPGPNSNTFTAWIARAVPELQVDLPPTAIGKDYLGSELVAAAPSGRGVQFSLFGLLGMSASPIEGLEVNVLGLAFGINPFDFSVKLPMVGRIGPARVFSTEALAVAPAGNQSISPR